MGGLCTCHDQLLWLAWVQVVWWMMMRASVHFRVHHWCQSIWFQSNMRLRFPASSSCIVLKMSRYLARSTIHWFMIAKEDAQENNLSITFYVLEEKHHASQKLEFVTLLHSQTYLENAFRKLPFWYSRINLTSVTSWKFNWDNPCSLLLSHLHFDGLCTYDDWIYREEVVKPTYGYQLTSKVKQSQRWLCREVY